MTRAVLWCFCWRREDSLFGNVTHCEFFLSGILFLSVLVDICYLDSGWLVLHTDFSISASVGSHRDRCCPLLFCIVKCKNWTQRCIKYTYFSQCTDSVELARIPVSVFNFFVWSKMPSPVSGWGVLLLRVCVCLKFFLVYSQQKKFWANLTTQV